MKFVSDPSIATKIQKMQSRVRFQHPIIQQQGIDQTYMVLDDGRSQDSQFSFLVLGDSGSQSSRNDHPQQRVAESMAELRPHCRFALHTGDVVYLVGSSEQYPRNFVRPYREFLSGAEPEKTPYDEMVFRTPIFPVLGNHDYYDLPLLFGIFSKLTAPLRFLLNRQFSIDVGWHGSWKGEAYARAFLDYLQQYEGDRLQQHLAQHYTGQLNQRRCLRYEPARFTRLPNRYYRFRYGGIDFFALDSNTFRHPLPIPKTEAGLRLRQTLIKRRSRYLQIKQKLMVGGMSFEPQPDKQERNFQDVYAKLEQIEEQIKDIEQQLGFDQADYSIDQAQLDWLTQELIQSWRDPAAKGRVVFLHHPPYVTEATKWNHGETLAIRYHLRSVLDAVEAAVTDAGPVGPVGPASTGPASAVQFSEAGLAQDVSLISKSAPSRKHRPFVDLVLSGHAHCLEYLTTLETGHGDRHIPWFVCGGSGFSLRQQRREGPWLYKQDLDLRLNEADVPASVEKIPGEAIAHSHLFLGRAKQGSHYRRPYSFLKIDVDSRGDRPHFRIVPQVVERFRGKWKRYALDAIEIGG